MTATYRALASVVMLIGFYVIAFLQLIAVIALSVWVLRHSHNVVVLKALIPLFIALGAVVVALWRAIRTKNEPEPGLIVGEYDAPALWATVRELAAVVGTRPPDEIRIVPEVNAAVTEQSSMLGLVGGRRFLYIGLPLLQSLRLDEMRSVLAHELGHYSGQHTQLAGVAYRGRLAIGGTIARIGNGNPIGWVFRGYARLYLLVDNAASRRQELEADRASVQVAGHQAAASALRSLPALDAAWSFYLNRYVEPGWDAGLAPDDFFGGFSRLLAARHAEISEITDNNRDEHGSRWDTHPPIEARVAAMRSVPVSAAVADDRPASVLLPDPALVGLRLQAALIDPGNRQILPWSEFIARTVALKDQEQADHVFRAVGRFTRSPQPSLATVFDLVHQQRLGEFAQQWLRTSNREEAMQRFTGIMKDLLDSAAVRAQVARWELSWSGPARLVDRSGQVLDFTETAKLAVDPATLGRAVAHLTALGINVAAVSLVQQRANARDSELVGGIANVKVDGTPYDLLLLNNGLVMVGNPGRANKGEERLRELACSAPVEHLANSNTFLPYEEIAAATIQRNVPAKAQLTLHDGRTMLVQETLGSEFLGDKTRDTFLHILRSLNP